MDGNANPDARLKAYVVDVRSSDNAVVRGVRTRNPFTYSIGVVASNNFCIEGSVTRSETQGRYDQLDGIHILNSSDGRVLRNCVDQGAGGLTSGDGDDGLVAHTIGGGGVHDVIYAGNTVRVGRFGSGVQLAYGSASDRIYNLTIQNNYFWGVNERYPYRYLRYRSRVD